MSRITRYQFLLAFIIVPWLLFGQFQRESIPFISNGVVLSLPQTGGFSNPQCNNMDVNQDGIDDLVVFDRDGQIVRTLIYLPEEERYMYDPSYEDIFPPDLSNFLQIIDYNGDGVEDLFSYSHIVGVPGVQVFRGIIENGTYAYTRVEYNNPDRYDLITYLDNGLYSAAYVSAIDYPAIGDVDNDGDIDLLSFDPTGIAITLYRNVAQEQGLPLDSLTFIYGDQCWGKFYESEFSQDLTLSSDPNRCPTSFESGGNVQPRHAGSAITLFDLNGDNLQDMVIGDLANSKLTSVRNGGSQRNAWMVDQDISFPSSSIPVNFPIFHTTQFVNVDADPEKEMVVAPNTLNGSSNKNFIWLYDNLNELGDGFSASQLSTSFLEDQTIDLTSYSVPALHDIDADGDLDMIVGCEGISQQTGEIEPRLYLFTNTGNPMQAQFELTDEDYLAMSRFDGRVNNSLAPAFGDLDQDGDADLVLGDFSGKLFYFENQSQSNVFSPVSAPVYPFEDIDIGQFAIPQIIDINDDGRQDLLIGERNGNSGPSGACGNINYFQNFGTNTYDFNPDVSVSPNTGCFGNIFTRQDNFFTGYSSPHLLLFEDKAVMITGSENRGIMLYESLGQPFATYDLRSDFWGEIHEGFRTHPRAVELDNDGFFELVVGNSRGGISIYQTNLRLDGVLSSSSEEPIISAFSCYPNPGNDRLILKAGQDAPSTFSVEVYSLSGKRMYQATNVYELDTHDWPSGLYLIRIHSIDGMQHLKWLKWQE